MANLSDGKLRVFDTPFEDKLVGKLISKDSEINHADGQIESKYDKIAWMNYEEDQWSRQKNLQAFQNRLREEDPRLVADMPDHDFLLKMLRGAGFSVDGAIRLTLSYVAMMREYTSYLAPAFDPKMELVRTGFSQQIHHVLPHRDCFGRRIHLLRPGKWIPDTIPFPVVFCCGLVMGELIAMESRTQIAGVTVIVDASDFGFKHLRNLSLQDLKHAAMFAQDHFPLWFRSIHLVNVPRVGEMAFRLLRPMLTQRVLDNILFHDSKESLHSHIDKRILPSELGGAAGPFDNATSAVHALQLSQHFKLIKRYVDSNANLR